MSIARIRALRESAMYRDLPECCFACLSQEEGKVSPWAGRHNEHSQSPHMCAAFHFQRALEMQQVSPQFVFWTCLHIAGTPMLQVSSPSM